MDYWRTRVKFGADKMVDLSISWKAWRGQQPGGFQIGHSSSLLSLILTHQYSNTPPILILTHQYRTNTKAPILLLVAAAPDALVACTNVPTNPTSSPFTPNCRLSGLTRKLLRLSSVLLATVALTIVEEKKPGSTTKTYPCQQEPQHLGFCEDKHH